MGEDYNLKDWDPRINMQRFIQKHTPVHITYNKTQFILYVATLKGRLYINLNSLTSETDKWKRGKKVTERLSDFNKRLSPFKPFYSLKNLGTWLILDLFEDFGNWFGKRTGEHLIGFGTYTKKHLPTFYKNYIMGKDPYFVSFKYNNKRCILRANRKTDFINLTDMSNIYERDLRGWKKLVSYKKYVKEYPDHINSSNASLDEFGIRTTYGHVDIARELLKWLTKKNNSSIIRDPIEEFLDQDTEEEESSAEEMDIDEKESSEEEMDIDETALVKPVVKHIEGSLKLNGYMIVTREEDGYINVTNLCKAGKREFKTWKRSIKSKAFLKVLSATVQICTVDLLKQNIAGNGKRHMWVHPQVAINIAQWISPEFDVQVSKWIYELALTGSVTLGKEKTSEELTEELRKKIGIDATCYGNKNVLYIFSFIPTQPCIVANNKKCYKFGVSEDVSNRLDQHSHDAYFSTISMRHIFKCGEKGRSRAEKRVKRLIKSLSLGLEYGSKKECFAATDEELETVCEELSTFLNNDKIENDYQLDYDSEVELARVDLEKCRLLFGLFDRDKLDYNQLNEMMDRVL